ncbi:MAG: hypothetical protein ACI867_000840 [Glaciecola sp.]|jgi:hypothetical protein
MGDADRQLVRCLRSLAQSSVTSELPQDLQANGFGDFMRQQDTKEQLALIGEPRPQRSRVADLRHRIAELIHVSPSRRQAVRQDDA